MKKPIILIVLVVAILLIGGCLIVLNMLMSNTNSNNYSDMETTGTLAPTANIGSKAEKVCDTIQNLASKGEFSGEVEITDDSDKNACFFNLGGIEYSLIDLVSKTPELEFTRSKTMFAGDDTEDVLINVAGDAYWSVQGNLLMVWDGDRIITITNSINDKAAAINLANIYLGK